MFEAMRPLPLRPEFPVFALSDSFTGFRWLALWQQANGPCDDVTEVQLGHGNPNDGPFVVVHSVLKQPGRDLGRGASVGAIGLEFTASYAALNAFDHLPPGRAEARAAIDPARQDVNWPDNDCPLEGWLTESVKIDGVVHSARVATIDDCQAFVIECSSVVIGVWGADGSLPEHWELTDVSGRLGEYKAGTDKSADTLLA